MSLPLIHRDLPLRAAGVALLTVAVASLYLLLHGPAAHGHGGWAGTLEAATGFVGGSLGAVLLVLGRHIHDRVAVSARWVHAQEDAG